MKTINEDKYITLRNDGSGVIIQREGGQGKVAKGKLFKREANKGTYVSFAWAENAATWGNSILNGILADSECPAWKAKAVKAILRKRGELK